MKNCLINKTGTLVQGLMSAGMIQTPCDQMLKSGVERQIEAMARQGWVFTITANMSAYSPTNPATGEPYSPMEAISAELKYCLALLPEAVNDVFFCPDPAGEECWYMWRGCIKAHKFDPSLNAQTRCFSAYNFRKPEPGMLLLAQWHSRPDVGEAEYLVVGEREDQLAAEAAGIPFMWGDQWRNEGL